MTLREVADFLRVSPQTIYKLVKEGSIPAVKVGHQWRFDRRRVASWLSGEGEEVGEGARMKDEVSARSSRNDIALTERE